MKKNNEILKSAVLLMLILSPFYYWAFTESEKSKYLYLDKTGERNFLILSQPKLTKFSNMSFQNSNGDKVIVAYSNQDDNSLRKMQTPNCITVKYFEYKRSDDPTYSSFAYNFEKFAETDFNECY